VMTPQLFPPESNEFFPVTSLRVLQSYHSNTRFSITDVCNQSATLALVNSDLRLYDWLTLLDTCFNQHFYVKIRKKVEV
jgi:hypothetical protein